MLDHIDTLVNVCQHCQGPLGDSPSEDFCSERCQRRWHAGVWHPGVPQHYEVRRHEDGWIVYDLIHDHPVANLFAELAVWAEPDAAQRHADFLGEHGLEGARPEGEALHLMQDRRADCGGAA